MEVGELGLGSAPAFRREYLLRESQEHAIQLSGWEQNYHQISRGAFHSRLVEIEFEDIHIFQEELSQAVFQTGHCRAGTVALGVFSAMSGEARWHGGAVGLDDVLFLEGCGELMLATPQTSCLMSVGLPMEALETLCDDLPIPVHERVGRLSATPLRDRRAATQLRQSITTVVGEILRRPGEKLPAAVTRQLRDELAVLVVNLLHGEPAANERRAADKAKKVVQRARNYAFERRDEPPTLNDVCRHAFVSLRTLQNCFQTVLGESPATYLKMLRLNGARRELLRPGDAARVSDVAANWGFWHLSQFSSDYRRMFGELPSETRYNTRGASSPASYRSDRPEVLTQCTARQGPGYHRFRPG